MAMQTLALTAIVGLTLAATLSCVMAALGDWPWLTMELRFGATPYPMAGMWLQIGGTALLWGLCFFLPANGRMMRLERSHRDFRISLDDIARAYAMAHEADRAGAFALASEFEEVRARMSHLRHHPELGHLEPEILELAAEMSHLSRDLARTYSDDKVARARTFLTQRREEIEQLGERIRLARYAVDELKRWMADTEAEEALAARQIAQLERDLRDVLPALGYDFEDVQQPVNPNVVHMPAKQPSS